MAYPSEIGDDASFGVPRLTESLRRCWFEYDLGKDIGGILSKGLDQLKHDHQSGARQLAGKALESLIVVASKLPLNSKEQWWRQIRMVAWHLWKNGRESMGAATLNVMISALAIVEIRLAAVSGAALSADFIQQVTADLQHYGQQRQNATDKIWKSLEEFFKSDIVSSTKGSDAVKILTLSSSSTIAACLTKAIAEFHQPFDIRILESRPLFEGVSLATKLLSNISNQQSVDNKTTVTLFTDASAAVAASDIDVLLIGADLLKPAGDVSNKVGSLPAALAVKHVCPTAKILVLAEKEKILPFSPPDDQEENDPSEVLEAWASSKTMVSSVNVIDQWRKEGNEANRLLTVKNTYFEWVPAELIDYFVFDDGIRKSNDLAKVANGLKIKFHRIFDDI
jgi:translation initiation factor 2B subunit (eIF-2B alpha/beta/delta family)